MATKQIPWNDGSGQSLTVVYSGVGSDIVSISSPANPGTTPRNKTLTFTAGTLTAYLQVTQRGREVVYTISGAIGEQAGRIKASNYTRDIYLDFDQSYSLEAGPGDSIGIDVDLNEGYTIESWQGVSGMGTDTSIMFTFNDTQDITVQPIVVGS